MEARRRKQISLAQNFLRSPKLVRRLVRMSKIGLSDTVYEIGPGKGIITAALANVAGQVIAIEKDPELVRHLRKRFCAVENVEIVERDFLNYSFHTCTGVIGRKQVPEYKMFANIPYNHTSQIVRTILQERSSLSEAYLILQKEAARKFSGSPRETLFSILVKPFFDFKVLAQLDRADFWPIPNVDSVLLSIKRRATPLIEAQDTALYREFVQYGFGRWKPNLKSTFKAVFTYRQWKHLACELHFPLKATPTQLSIEQWVGLYSRFRAIRRHVATDSREGKAHSGGVRCL
jgi:16S rRNA A1518/A1519 N6-dimethyltransferase RsmA/KsgA/DIM1 with predicted DNA glycosylase/AP lyase activity